MDDFGDPPTAYGLGLRGLQAERELLGAPQPSFPVVSIAFVEGDAVWSHQAEMDGAMTDAAISDNPVTDGPTINGGHVERRLLSGHILRASRSARTATVTGPPIPSDSRIHPFLTPIAGVHNRWLGREVFHAGVFAAADRAWVVPGQREAGKSSLLAGLAGRGHTVLADDIAVIDATTVYSGPRCIDLRESVPGLLHEHTTVRRGSRARVLLPPAPASLPLGGWLFPRWGNEMRLIPVPPAELIGTLARIRRRPSVAWDAGVLLGLAGHPAWILERPRDWAYAERSLSAVLAAVCSAVGPSASAASR